MTTLNELEKAGMEAIEERKKIAHKQFCAAADAEAQSKARMKEVVLDCLVQFCGLENGDELRPLLIVDREYRRGTSAALLNVPGVDAGVAQIRFGYRAFQNPDDKDTLVIEMERASPFCFTWNNPTYYATLGEALYIARQKQVQADEYSRQEDERERMATECYQERQAKAEQEHNDRVSFLIYLMDRHSIVLPLLRTLEVYLDCEAELKYELDEALQ